MAASNGGEKVADDAVGAGEVLGTHLSSQFSISILGNGKAFNERRELHLIELHHAIGTALIFLWKMSLQTGQEGIFLPFEG